MLYGIIHKIYVSHIKNRYTNNKEEFSINLDQLNFFKTVAECGSISKAARKLNYAQSNTTTKIQQLESHFQTTLFYRHNLGITLTSHGEILLSYTKKIFRLIDETNKAMLDDNMPKGPLTIGSMETTAAVRLPPILSKYHHIYPDVDFTLITGPTEQNIKAVLQYELDGALVAGPVEHPDLNQETVIEEELVLITNTTHPELSTLKDIQNRTLLVFRSGCSYREKLEQWLHYEGITPNKIMEFGTLDAIIGCVSAGLGISSLPISIIKKHPYNNIRIHEIPSLYSKVNTVFIYRKDEYSTIALKKFRDMLHEENLV